MRPFADWGTPSREVQQLPSQLHIFCPRQDDDDLDRYEDNDADQDAELDKSLEQQQRRQRIQDAISRRETVFSCLSIFSFEGDEAVPHQEALKSRLDAQLQQCDICIREYYKGKRAFLEGLRSEYDDEQVVTFSQFLDDMDIKRINAGLESAAASLRAVPEKDRKLKALKHPDMFAIFEALNCEAFLRSEDLLSTYFDPPFKMLQQRNKKTLKIQDYLPAATWLLFDADRDRSDWAKNIWISFDRGPTQGEFEWAIREPLSKTLMKAAMPELNLELIQRLWPGLEQLIGKLDKHMITHSIRAMDVDVCRLALEHMQHPIPSFKNLLATVEILLEKSPDDFWDAMGAVSPPTVIEQIFNNRQVESMLAESTGQTTYQTSPLADLLSWVDPLLNSVSELNKAPALRSLTFQLLDRLQASHFPAFARYHCSRVGLKAISRTLHAFSEAKTPLNHAQRLVVSETLAIVGSHMQAILVTMAPPDDSQDVEDRPYLRNDVIEQALKLDCQSLKADKEVLDVRGELNPPTSYHPDNWNSVMPRIRDDDVPLVKAVLLGIQPLVGVDKAANDGSQKGNGGAGGYNTVYDRISGFVAQILERLANFNPVVLEQLYGSVTVANSLIGTLFSADDDVYQASIDLLKTLSGRSVRAEAIAHLLKTNLGTSLFALAWSVRRTSHTKAFGSARRMLKTGNDIRDILCDTSEGVLRKRSLEDKREASAVEHYWEYQWQALQTSFELTEKWSKSQDKDLMREFCRDTIEFSQKLFDQYGVFGSALASGEAQATPELMRDRKEAIYKRILKYPNKTMNVMVKWLRLRDDFLVDAMVDIIIKLLGKLGDNRLAMDREPLHGIELAAAATRERFKTNLSDKHKAELIRALRRYYQKGIVDPEGRLDDLLRESQAGTFKKQGKIDLWAKSGDGKSSPRTPDTDDYGDSDIPDSALLGLTKALPRRVPEQKPAARPTQRMVPSKPAPPARSENEMAAFRLKRQKEMEEKKQRDALMIARIKKPPPNQPGEGSGLNGIGIKGKDHSRQEGESMMVSSESESESDDELDREILRKLPSAKQSANVEEYNKSKAQAHRLSQAAGPVKKKKLVRSAKDMRARLAPDLTVLHQTILSWDYFADGPFPPHSDRTDYSLVSNTFRDPMMYKQTFGGLLTLEAWQGFLKAKEEGNFKTFEIKVSNRMSVDSFAEITTVMPAAERDNLGITKADIVLLSKSRTPTQAYDEPHCLARIWEVTRNREGVLVTYRVLPNNMIPGVGQNTIIFGTKIASLLTLEREYGALLGLQYYDLCDEIIRARPSPILDYPDRILDTIGTNYELNKAQAKAVKSATDNDAFTLIQG